MSELIKCAEALAAEDPPIDVFPSEAIEGGILNNGTQTVDEAESIVKWKKAINGITGYNPEQLESIIGASQAVLNECWKIRPSRSRFCRWWHGTCLPGGRWSAFPLQWERSIAELEFKGGGPR
jgi:hypothetical protein